MSRSMRRALIAPLLILAMIPAAGRATTATSMLYVTVDDGTEIAVRVFFPDSYDAGEKFPALLEIEGYGGASSPSDSSFVGNASYIVVAVSVRGTGCSQGKLDLFSERSNRDGAFIINEWIPAQSWSNGDVGVYGHSYGGLHGFLTAAASGKYYPTETHLKATAVSGLIDDFYRGILYPGGISNYGFPILWGALLRPFSEHSSNSSFIQNDEHCRANYATHQGSDAVPTPQIVADTYGSPFATPDSWAIRESLLARAKDLNAPIQLGQQYQDEQTGPRGGHVLFQGIPAGVPKRITVSTGVHNPNDPTGNKRDWFDCWILGGATTTRGKACSDVKDPNQNVLLYFESKGSDRLAPYIGSDWPLPETVWTSYKLCADGALAASGACAEGSQSYVNTSNSRHMTLNMGRALPLPTNDSLSPYGFTTGLPDTLRYTATMGADAAIAGPINLTMYASISSADTNFWAEILDVAPDGSTTFVQRGLLRAAAAAQLNTSKSQYAGGNLYRPYYEYTALTPVVPGAINKYEVEIFPLGHVWRAGHQFVLQLHAPPANDPLSTYAYQPTSPSVVTVFQNPSFPTSILLPFMPALPPHRATAPACGSVVGELCITPALG